MDDSLKLALWQQFGAAIDMLDNAILTCPEDLWSGPQLFPEPWQLVHHTLFWLDLYLYGAVEGFKPPAPFALEELDPSGIFPETVYTIEQLRDYLHSCREKCRKIIFELDDESAARRCRFPWGEVSYFGLLIYNLRHVQHGAAQLNLLLRQSIDRAGKWVGVAKKSPDHT
ncbi:MAG: DinB family protein [bacterium]